MGEPKIDCPNSGWKCKVRFPIKKVDLVTDFKLNKLVCTEKRTPIEKCTSTKEEKYVEINRYKVGFDMAGTGAKEMPEISAEINIRPGEPLEQMLRVDPQSVQLKIVPEMAFGLNADLDLLDKEWDQVKDKINHPDKCRFNPSLAKTEGQIANLNDEIRLEAHKPYIANDLSLMYYDLSKGTAKLLESARRNPNVGDREKANLSQAAQELTQGLSNRLGGALADMLNSAMQNSEGLKGGPTFGLPIVTPKSFSSPGLDDEMTPNRTQDLKVTGTGTDKEGNLVAEVSNCKADFNNMNNHKIVPKFQLAPGATSGASLSLNSLNAYLRAMVRDDQKNTVSIAGQQKSSVSALNSDIEYQFKINNLELMTKDNPDTKNSKNRKLVLKFSADEKTSSFPLLNPVYNKTQKSVSGEVEIKKNDEGKLDLILDPETFKRFNTDRSSFSLFLSAIRSSLEVIFIKDIIVQSIYVKTLNSQLTKINLRDYLNDHLANKITGNSDSTATDFKSTKDMLRYDLKQFEVSEGHLILSGAFTNQNGPVKP